MRRIALAIAAKSGRDPRTCERALRLGVQAIRGYEAQDQIADAMRELGIDPNHPEARVSRAA